VRILVVDDEPTLLRASRRALARVYDVVTADGGAKAVELLAADPGIGAVVCDLQMPEVSGIEVHAAIERLRPDLVPRVLFATGGGTSGEAKAFLARPDIRLLPKPYSGRGLRQAVQELLGQRFS